MLRMWLEVVVRGNAARGRRTAGGSFSSSLARSSLGTTPSTRIYKWSSCRTVITRNELQTRQSKCNQAHLQLNFFLLKKYFLRIFSLEIVVLKDPRCQNWLFMRLTKCHLSFYLESVYFKTTQNAKQNLQRITKTRPEIKSHLRINFWALFNFFFW